MRQRDQGAAMDLQTCARDHAPGAGTSSSSASSPACPLCPTGATCVDGTCEAPASCAPGGTGMTNCGASQESCCTSLEVTGGVYFRTYTNDGSGPTREADPASVSIPASRPCPARAWRTSRRWGTRRRDLACGVSSTWLGMFGSGTLTGTPTAMSTRAWIVPILPQPRPAGGSGAVTSARTRRTCCPRSA
jgi:hypothetical protein